jgi:hypothetical protein
MPSPLFFPNQFIIQPSGKCATSAPDEQPSGSKSPQKAENQRDASNGLPDYDQPRSERWDVSSRHLFEGSLDSLAVKLAEQFLHSVGKNDRSRHDPQESVT